MNQLGDRRPNDLVAKEIARRKHALGLEELEGIINRRENLGGRFSNEW